MDEKFRDIGRCADPNQEVRDRPWIVLRQYEDGMVLKEGEGLKARCFAIDKAKELARNNPHDKFLIAKMTDMVSARVTVDVECLTMGPV